MPILELNNSAENRCLGVSRHAPIVEEQGMKHITADQVMEVEVAEDIKDTTTSPKCATIANSLVI